MLWLILISVGLGGCQNECQRLCDRMAAQLDACGIPQNTDALSGCYLAYEQVTDVEENQCASQTAVVLEQNLMLRGSNEGPGDDPCMALKPYAP